ncbi:hypothetical protein F5148DRAFT_1329649 [Russula earlei]|uniref:Uncharacterized protein n=1 Tax=Russula earlei TaxID=71964 RepID=A0ACC0TYZ8_9AGAM|nr:hypothetical protein F5148DRAFT_1329649 [Russula earlei]
MQEIVLDAHLAYLYLSSPNQPTCLKITPGDKTREDFSNSQGNPIPARVPLTALLSGTPPVSPPDVFPRPRLISSNPDPIAGDPFPSSANTPPAVIPAFFKQICPNPTIIDRVELNGPLWSASGATLFSAWLDKLERIEDRCPGVPGGHTEGFSTFGAFSSALRLTHQPDLICSSDKVIRRFDQIARLVAFALHLADPDSFLLVSAHHRRSCCERGCYPSRALLRHLVFLHAPSKPRSPQGSPRSLHPAWRLSHCVHLGEWSAHYMDFNELPGFPDRFSLPAKDGQGNPPQGQSEIYSAHCFPDIKQIVLRVRARPEWLRELTDALQEDARRAGLDGWDRIGTSRDLHLTREQRHNSQALDMAVAQRAKVFIGNGVFYSYLPGVRGCWRAGLELAFDGDVQLGHAARCARLPLGENALLVKTPKLFTSHTSRHAFVYIVRPEGDTVLALPARPSKYAPILRFVFCQSRWLDWKGETDEGSTTPLHHGKDGASRTKARLDS